jgi:hypothetical protein
MIYSRDLPLPNVGTNEWCDGDFNGNGVPASANSVESHHLTV